MFNLRKKLPIVGGLFLGLFLLSACQEDEQQTTTDATTTSTVETPRIALVMKTLTNPFFISMEQGARQAETEFGIELIVRTAGEETSIYQQIDIVNELTRHGNIDAIVIAPGDSVELLPALKAAQDANIQIVNIDNKLDNNFAEKFGLSPIPFISVNNEAAAYLSAKHIADMITVPTQVAILEGIPTAANAQARKAGAVRAFDENKNITVVASQPAFWKIDEAYNVTRELFANHPDIKGIFAANDMMAIGVIRYLEEAGLKNIPVAGFDAIDEAIKAVKSGKLNVTIDQLPAKQGYMGVKTALDLLQDKKVSDEILIDVKVIDAETVE